jgi:hypothetical protein
VPLGLTEKLSYMTCHWYLIQPVEECHPFMASQPLRNSPRNYGGRGVILSTGQTATGRNANQDEQTVNISITTCDTCVHPTGLICILQEWPTGPTDSYPGQDLGVCLTSQNDTVFLAGGNSTGVAKEAVRKSIVRGHRNSLALLTGPK